MKSVYTNVMKNKYLAIAAGVLVVGAIGFYGLDRNERFEGMMGHYGNDNDDRGELDKNANNNQNGAMSGRDKAGGMNHGAEGQSLSERKFLEEMIPHHQEAVDTAKQELARGENADTKKLAQEIITAQEKEIADMKSWYKTWYGVEYQNDTNYKAMMGTLANLSGNKLDRAFLEGMIKHHMAALMMAQAVVPNIQHKEVEGLAKNIAETQSSQIITMRILLKQI